jgi:hypothetical protein
MEFTPKKYAPACPIKHLVWNPKFGDKTRPERRGVSKGVEDGHPRKGHFGGGPPAGRRRVGYGGPK